MLPNELCLIFNNDLIEEKQPKCTYLHEIQKFVS